MAKASIRGARPSPDFEIGGGGGSGSGAERVNSLDLRLSLLEKDVERVNGDINTMKSDMRDVRDRILKLEEAVKHLPTKTFYVTTLLTSLTVFATLLGIAVNFQNLTRTSAPQPQIAPRAGTR